MNFNVLDVEQSESMKLPYFLAHNLKKFELMLEVYILDLYYFVSSCFLISIIFIEIFF